MSKHYHIHYGVRQTHKLRYFIVAVVFLSSLGFGGYSTLLNSPSQNVAQVSKAVLNQAPQAQAATVLPQITTPMPWPKYGYAAYGVPKDKLYAASDDEAQAVPIASLAKVITVLAILKEKPLQVGEQGPMITFTEQDVELVNEYARKSGTFVPVLAGEQISQYQALQAILLVSANNMSDSLAIWAFGSVDKYVVYANKMLKDLGLDDTVVADASGFSPNTVSIPENMTELGFLYMQNPVLREIAKQQSATIPVAGFIRNNNSFANEEGVIGIKIGNTEEAGKTYLAASIRQGNGSSEEISIAVVLGAKNLNVAAKDAQTILKAGNVGHDRLNL